MLYSNEPCRGANDSVRLIEVHSDWFLLMFCTVKCLRVSGGTRTHSLRIRSPARYPLRHGVYCDLRQFKDVWSFESICVMFWAFFSAKTPSHLNSKHLLLNTSFRSNTRRKLFRRDHLSIAQLVERRTVVGNTKQRSLGHWFKSGSREVFFSKTTTK